MRIPFPVPARPPLPPVTKVSISVFGFQAVKSQFEPETPPQSLVLLFM